MKKITASICLVCAIFASIAMGQDDKRKVLVVFGAEWCGPCQSLHKEIDKNESKILERYQIVFVDIDENKAEAKRYGVQKIPFLVVQEFDGEKWKTEKETIGFRNFQNLSQWLGL